MIKLVFGRAKNGWLLVELRSGDKLLYFDASYMPTDFVEELTNALLGILHGPGEFAARLNEEPAESEWQFYRIQEAATFCIMQYPNDSRQKNQGEKLIETYGTPLEVVLPFWRGLRELGNRRLKDNYKAHWSAAFPQKKVELLTEMVNQAKEAV